MGGGGLLTPFRMIFVTATATFTIRNADMGATTNQTHTERSLCSNLKSGWEGGILCDSCWHNVKYVTGCIQYWPSIVVRGLVKNNINFERAVNMHEPGEISHNGERSCIMQPSPLFGHFKHFCAPARSHSLNKLTANHNAFRRLMKNWRITAASASGATSNLK